MRKASGGFTLIELIVVIVILGILAVTAAPKFIDLQSDARTATLNGMKAAINSAVSLSYGKALVVAEDKKENGSIKINGTEQQNILTYGYPKATATAMKAVMDLDDATFKECAANVSADWCYVETQGEIKIYIGNMYTVPTNENPGVKCFVDYKQSTALGKTPEVTVEKTGC